MRGGAFTDDASVLRSAARSHTRHKEWLKTDPQQPQSIWWYRISVRSVSVSCVNTTILPERRS